MRTNSAYAGRSVSSKSTSSALPGNWNKFLLIPAALYAVFVMVYLLTEIQKPAGGVDFHPFWYAGHFILEGRDPYAAYLNNEQLEFPVRYLDGVVINEYPVQTELSYTPTNTSTMLLLLTLFSPFSWTVAKWIFFLVNLTIMLVTGWLALRHIPFTGFQLNRLDEVLILLLYFDFSATRIAIENGQTTLIVFLMMLLALIFAKHSWKLAGLALGIALSKYSLALAVFLFFLYKRNFRVLFLAVAIQILGILAMAAITGTSPVTLIQENIQIATEVFDQPGIHLYDFFKNFTENNMLAQIPVLMMTLLIFIPLILWLRRHTPTSDAEEEILDFHVLTVLFLWTLLVEYHRLYDTLVLILFLVLVFKGLAYPNLWRLSHKGKFALWSLLAILPLILILPARIADKVLPNFYGTISDATTTVFLVAMLTTSMLLTRRFLQNPETTHPTAQPVDV